MGRKRSNSTPEPTKPNRTPYEAIYVRVNLALGKALRDYLNSLRPQPDKSAVLHAALEDFLEGKGFWPPRDA